MVTPCAISAGTAHVSEAARSKILTRGIPRIYSPLREKQAESVVSLHAGEVSELRFSVSARVAYLN